jgi:Flp pilus assembly pilin Flp
MPSLSNAARSAYAWPEAKSNRGVSAIEYAILLVLIGVVTITSVTLVGQNLPSVFSPAA